MSTTPNRQPSIFLPHGGGPCFFMDWTWGPADTWHATQHFLESLPSMLPAPPKALLVVSGHWEEPAFTAAAVDHHLGQRNLRSVVEPLCDLSRTPLERVMRLQVTDASFRNRLLSLFELVPPEDVERWGQLVATDPSWRDLALEHWPLESSTPPEFVRVDLELLKLPARDDGLLVYDPREKLRIADVLQCVVERLGPQAESSLVQLAIDCGGGTLVGEFEELVEALYNLASNALLASPPGSTV